MAPCVHEIDESAFKARRAVSRARSLHKKRAEFQRTCKGTRRPSSAAPEGRDDKLRTRPHRVARAAARTCLAKGLVEVAADMPTIVYMDCAGWRKPSVAARMDYAAVPRECSDVDPWCCSQGYLEEYMSAAACLDVKDCFSVDVADAESTASGESNSDVSESLPMVGKDDSPKTTGDDHALLLENMGAEDSSPAADNSVEDVQRIPEERTTPSEEACDNAEAGMPLTRREAVLCNLARHLRAQALEERQRAQAAEAEQQLLTRCQRHRSSVELKEGLRCQQQMAASLRRRRNQEAQISALKRKADRALQDAREAQEQAEAEALAARAQHLALADLEAQERAEAMAAAAVAAAQAEAEDLAQRRFAEVASIEAAARARAQAEADALKAKAEAEASAARSQAESLQAQAQLEVRQLKMRAEVEARVIKARAAMEVRERHAQMEAELDKVSQYTQASPRVTKGGQKTAEASPKESTASLLRQAKLMQRQKAQQLRKQAEQDRQREQQVARELQERRAKAEEEASSVVARAVASAEALKAKARGEVQAAKAWAEEKARHTAEEAEATRLAAEELAWDIKAKAEQEAQALMAQKVLQQAEREAAIEAPEVPKVEAGSQDTSYCGKGKPMQLVEAEWEVLVDDTEDPDAGVFDWKIIA